MPRTARASVGDVCYHMFNRGNGRAGVSHRPSVYAAFVELIGEACSRRTLRVLAYCLMPNHTGPRFLFRPHSRGEPFPRIRIPADLGARKDSRTSSQIALTVIALLFHSDAVRAGPVTWEFLGEVLRIIDPDNRLIGTVVIGSPIEGTFAFETMTPDSDPSQTTGWYDNSVTRVDATSGALSLTGPTRPDWDKRAPAFIGRRREIA